MTEKCLDTATPIRVIHLASGDLWGGAEAVVYNLVKGLKAHRGLDLMVVLLNKGRLVDVCIEEGVPTRIVDEAKFNFPQLVFQLRRLAGNFKPDIIHSHGYKENVLALLARPLHSNAKLTTTIHGLFEGHGKFKTRIAIKFELLALRFFFNKIVAVSGEIAQTLSQIYSIPPQKIETIRNGIEMPKGPRHRTAKKEGITIGSAGRLFPVKDYPFMVDIAKELCAKRDDVRFILAGDGPDREKIVSKIHEYGISDRFKLLGHLDDMKDFYSQIDLYLNTSHHEGLPMTIIEAMTYSIPIVAPHVGGLPEIVEHTKTGWLVKNRSAGEFVRVIERALSNGRETVSVGKRARDMVEEQFSIDCMSESYMNMYIDLVR